MPAWREETFEHRRTHEAADVAKLAVLTRVDRSTIFFDGFTASGYVRDGTVRNIQFRVVKEPLNLQCRGKAVSRDGARIAYVLVADDAKRCEIVVRDLSTGRDTTLVYVAKSYRMLAWSWGDTEIAYEGPAGIMAVSTADGQERIVARRPFRINGTPIPSGYFLESVDWRHDNSQLVVDANICVPTGEPDACQHENHTLIVSPSGDSRLLAVGKSPSVSPTADLVALASRSHVEVINADGSNRRRLTRIPALFDLALFREWVGPTMLWSPGGDRLLFGTVIDEESNGNYYLVEIESGRRQRVLTNTSIDVTAWR
ncbi:MAG TPA: hypothetical protein VFT39_02685 [Vicinamibacterales bacterium]|nr:hypothetical protein [Vicinamibacterales bacterium]